MHKNNATYMLFFIATIIASASAFSTSSIYTVSQCSQTNASYLICPDGMPIKISFAISAPYSPPYMGNFSVYPIQYWNTSEITNIYGSQCIVPASETTTCFVTVNAIPISASNGIVSKSIKLKLISSSYPQITFNETLNVSIEHYITSGELFIENLYNSTASVLETDNYTYSYFCGVYSICSANLESNISSAAHSLALAKAQLYNSMLLAAYSNITAANSTLYSIKDNFSSFANTSSAIVSAGIKAKYMLANSTGTYYKHEKELYNCTFPNGTRYSSYLSNYIKAMNNYSTLNTLSGANAYLGMATKLSSNETSLIEKCTRGAGTALIKLPIGFNYMLYFFAAIVIILLAYAALRLIDLRNVSKMRGSNAGEASAGTENALHEVPEQQAEAVKDIGIKEIPQSNAEEEGIGSKTTESYFDNWFSSAISKKSDAEAKDESGTDSNSKPKQGKQGKGKKQK
ncbi:MAG: hypothetical protein ACP5RF_04025 [Candidatus Micrarchaeia archaeon]